jgi:hypothetical protein
MTLTDIDRELPNGFHDAYLLRIAADYAKATLSLDLSLWVGTPDGRTPDERERRKPGRIRIAGLCWCIMAPPDSILRANPRGFRIDAGPISDLEKPPTLPALPPGVFSWWFFVSDWNTSIYVAGQSASLEWKI